MTLVFESFDRVDEPEQTARETKSDEYLRGYEAGFASATAELEQTQAALAEELAGAVSDISFSYAEAKQELQRQLIQFLRVLLEKLLPEVSQPALVSNLHAYLLACANEDLDAGLKICVSSADYPAISRVLDQDFLGHRGLSLQIDETLKAGSVTVSGRQTATCFDADEALRQIENALSAAIDETVGANR